jgi:phospholipid/cholesterol/gamma-HCH transport system substrate-binding protein
MNQRGLEIKVGIFVLTGLLIICWMAVWFGKVGQGTARTYQITVRFTNAAGVIKNTDVQLAGARIGTVAENPHVVPGQVGFVDVRLRIREDIKLPVGSRFQIVAAGMMGDRQVAVTPSDRFRYNPHDTQNPLPLFDATNPAMVIAPGSIVYGFQTATLGELTARGEESMVRFSETLDELRATLQQIKTGVLSEDNVSNLHATFANLKTTSDAIAQASGRIDDIMTLASDTFGDARKTIGIINSTVTEFKGIATAAQRGQGVLPLLLHNRETADNLQALIANMRRHGMLFYRDSAQPANRPRR